MLDIHHIKIHVASEDKLGQVVKAETSLADKIFTPCDGQVADQWTVFDRDPLGVPKWSELNSLEGESVEVTTSIK